MLKYKKQMALGCLIFVSNSMVYSQQAEPHLALTPSQMAKVQALYGDEAEARVAEWLGLLAQLRRDAGNDAEKMQPANAFFNHVPWISDQEHWGVEDYWATPIEMLGTYGGDCEDYSVAKYFSLKDVGVEAAKLRITYVKSLEFNQAHMVLAYYPSPEAEPLILDNINKSILPASQRADLVPVYSFNGDGLWLAQSRGKKLSAKTEESLPHWRSLNDRLREQFNTSR